MMEQTPAHDHFNPDLLNVMPRNLGRVVEVGCSNGGLARAYINENLACEYTGIEIDPAYAERARASCSSVICADIESISETVFASLFPSDCWIFGDSLEHLRDPWAVLRRIRGHLHPEARVIACIPNAQHWSVQARLNSGQFRYEDAGLLDRTHLRWFTRITIIELFQSTGYKILEGHPRIVDDPRSSKWLPSIRAMAEASGIDPQVAENDALVFQHIVVAAPV